ncbi:MAG: hypothetical protein WDN04_13760 [Rhodospirillales bacterium]
MVADLLAELRPDARDLCRARLAGIGAIAVRGNDDALGFGDSDFLAWHGFQPVARDLQLAVGADQLLAREVIVGLVASGPLPWAIRCCSCSSRSATW